MAGINKDFNLSYWEKKQYFTKHDLVVVGSGIVGLSAAIAFVEKNKKARVLVIDAGIFPDGASTKNAGFACFGSAGELISDLNNTDEELVWQTVEMRWKGLQLLRKRIGDQNMHYLELGGYELYYNKDQHEASLEKLNMLNAGMKKHLGLRSCYKNLSKNKLKFPACKGIIYNQYEGQLDTGLMMQHLIRLAVLKGIEILNNVSVIKIQETHATAHIHTSIGDMTSDKIIVATNGFASQLIKVPDVEPARAQVLITKPIPGLHLKGTFHFDEGYYYFRNINNRVLFGGGRNLDFKTERTTDRHLNARIQQQLDLYLRERILPDTKFEIEQRWTGIMGVGKEKKPIIRSVGQRTVAAVRMGGMGIAIGSWVGKKAASLIAQL